MVILGSCCGRPLVTWERPWDARGIPGQSFIQRPRRGVENSSESGENYGIGVWRIPREVGRITQRGPLTKHMLQKVCHCIRVHLLVTGKMGPKIMQRSITFKSLVRLQKICLLQTLLVSFMFVCSRVRPLGFRCEPQDLLSPFA